MDDGCAFGGAWGVTVKVASPSLSVPKIVHGMRTVEDPVGQWKPFQVLGGGGSVVAPVFVLVELHDQNGFVHEAPSRWLVNVPDALAVAVLVFEKPTMPQRAPNGGFGGRMG